MLIGQILRIWEWSGAQRLLAVLVSAAMAFVVTVATAPMAPMPMVAGAAQVSLMQDEHTLVADYLSRKADADRAADVAASRERDEMRTVAAAADVPTVPLPRPQPVRLAVSAATKIAAEPSSPQAPTASPLQLQSANSPPRPASAPKGARAVLATVERVPRWAWAVVQNAADWAIIGPVQTIARLPERRFL